MPVCGDSWDSLDANVLCKELGFPKLGRADKKHQHQHFGYSGERYVENATIVILTSIWPVSLTRGGSKV